MPQASTSSKQYVYLSRNLFLITIIITALFVLYKLKTIRDVFFVDKLVISKNKVKAHFNRKIEVKSINEKPFNLNGFKPKWIQYSVGTNFVEFEFSENLENRFKDKLTIESHSYIEKIFSPGDILPK